MNNQNDANQNGKPGPESNWAKWIEQRRQFFSGDSSEVPPIPLEDLQTQQLDDLELDGQLRMLGRISDPDDSFVDRVVAETGAGSKPDVAAKRRLPVVDPPRLRFEAPPMGTVESDASLCGSSKDESSTDESSQRDSLSGFEQGEVRSASTLKGQLLQNRLLVLVSSLAITLVIGFSLWGLARSGSSAPISAEVKPTVSPRSDENDDATNSPTVSELVEHSVRPKDVSEEPRPDSLESRKPRLVTNEGRLSDDEPTRKEFRRRGTSSPDQLPELPWGSIEKNARQRQPRQLANAPVDQTANITDKPRLQWHLTMEFDGDGIGRMTLNEDSLMAIVLQDNADFVLRQVSVELNRRFRFLENRLGSEMDGFIRVGGRTTLFSSIDEFDGAIDRSLDQLKQILSSSTASAQMRSLLRASKNAADPFMAARARSRQLMRDNWEKVKLIDLQNRKRMFYTDDEAFTVCNVLAASEVILKDLAKERLAWDADNARVLKSNQRRDSIAAQAFITFAKSGKLKLPAAENSAARIASIQKRDADELRRMLFENTTSYDLFRNINEFKVARQFVKNYAEKYFSGLSIDAFAEFEKKVLETQTARLVKQRDLEGLPLVMGDECHASSQEAVSIGSVSRSLGRAISNFSDNLGSRDPSQSDAFRRWQIKGTLKSVVGDYGSVSTASTSTTSTSAGVSIFTLFGLGGSQSASRRNADAVKRLEARNDAKKASDLEKVSQRLRTADQILQIDHPRLRLELIEALKKSETSEGLRLLAKRAKYDLFPEVRIAATSALAGFPREEYRAELLEGLTYPWHVVAQHSAEALVRLQDEEAIPDLVAMLDLPHPETPVEVGRNEFVQPRLVAINHMKNCLLCHAPAGGARSVAIGVVPSWEEPIPREYYGSPGAVSVRADITYLEQDFSVIQPVKNHGPWPQNQRFDYVVRRKPIKRSAATRLSNDLEKERNLNREAIVYALRKLTNESPADNSSSSWKQVWERQKAQSATKKSVSMR